MPLRTRIFIIVTAAVLLILAITILLEVGSHRTAPTGPTSTAGVMGPSLPGVSSAAPELPTPGGIATPIAVTASSATPIAADIQQNAARQLAKIFVERYNSFSTQNNYQNIRDVQTLVTPALWKRISRPLGLVPATTTVVAVTTQVITASLASFADTAATVLVTAQKITEKNGQRSSQYQDTTVTMVASAGGWLVDSFAAAPRR